MSISKFAGQMRSTKVNFLATVLALGLRANENFWKFKTSILRNKFPEAFFEVFQNYFRFFHPLFKLFKISFNFMFTST